MSAYTMFGHHEHEMKPITHIILLTTVALLSSGCATALYTDKVTYGDYQGTHYSQFDNYAKGAFEGAVLQDGKPCYSYIFPDCVFVAKSNLRFLVPVTNGLAVIVSRTSDAVPTNSPAYLRIRSIKNYGYKVDPVHPMMALKAIGEVDSITCDGSEQDRFRTSYPAFIGVNLTFKGKGSTMRIGQQVPREMIARVESQIGYSRYIEVHNPSMEQVTQKEQWIIHWSPDDNPYVLANSFTPMPLTLKRDFSRLAYVVTVPLDIVTLPIMWPFYVVSHNLNWHE